MSDTEVKLLTLENCEVVYTYQDGTVTVFSYQGQPHDVIRQLLERYLLPRNKYLEHPYLPEAPWWGNNPL